MSVQTLGRPMAFECECGAKYMIAKWERDTLGNYTVENIMSKHDFYVCPFCVSKTANMEEVEL
jgi:hypothetical protein